MINKRVMAQANTKQKKVKLPARPAEGNEGKRPLITSLLKKRTNALKSDALLSDSSKNESLSNTSDFESDGQFKFRRKRGTTAFSSSQDDGGESDDGNDPKRLKSSKTTRSSQRKITKTMKSIKPKSSLLDISSESEDDGEDLNTSIEPALIRLGTSQVLKQNAKKPETKRKPKKSVFDGIDVSEVQIDSRRVSRTASKRRESNINNDDNSVVPSKTNTSSKTSSKSNLKTKPKAKPKTKSTTAATPKSAPKSKQKSSMESSVTEIVSINDVGKQNGMPEKVKPRKSDRRVSLGNRGKRTSSIGNGFEVAPHNDVPYTTFYKHLNQDLPEPHKMRQLLVWCFKRQLESEKTQLDKEKIENEDLVANNIAKVIKEEIIRDLVEGKVDTSWWNREETESQKRVKVVKNERNIANAKTLKALEKRLAKIKQETKDWEKLSESFESKQQIEESKQRPDDDDIEIRFGEYVQSHRETFDGLEHLLQNTHTQEIAEKFETLKQTHKEVLGKFSNFTDKMVFNDAVIKNFEYNRKSSVSKIFTEYLEKSSVDKVDDDDDDGVGLVTYDDYELLRGITKIEKP